MSRTKRIALIILTVLVSLLLYRLIHQPTKKRPPTQLIPVKVARVKIENIPISLQALGTVQPYRIVTVEPMISGPMIKVYFHQGQNVHKGQLLAEIDPRPYQAALNQALAKRAEDEATYAIAENTLKRYNLLIAHNYISALSVAQQRATVAEARAVIAQDNAAIETAQTNLSYTRITAPINGRTGILAINAGNIVTPGTTGGIVTITTIQPIYVFFSLPQQDLSPVLQSIKRKLPHVTAYTGTGSHKKIIGHGTLTVLDNTINTSTGTLSLKARFDNPHLALWPGAFVNVSLAIRTERNAITVPSIAIRQGPSGPFVYVVHRLQQKNQNRPSSSVTSQQKTVYYGVTATPVRLGFANQRITVVKTSLKAGERVVTVGGSRLSQNAHIHILSSVHHASERTLSP